jgi:ABC-type microcin C transport system permease subunit YejB
MKTISTLLFPSFLSVLALLFTSCGSSPGSVMDDMISEMNAMTEIFKGIESKEDYESAKDDLDASQARLKELGEQLKDLDVSDEEKMELTKEYGGKLFQAALQLGNASGKAVTFGFTLEPPNFSF